MHAARFIGAVLAPHHAEDAKLGEIRVAAQDFLDARVFLGRKPVLGRDLRRDCRLCASGGHDLYHRGWVAPIFAAARPRFVAIRTVSLVIMHLTQSTAESQDEMP